ncbi:hypothetical protein BaRGS_00030257 [Batillaria attramentaria]|uniref:Uncharacterized protein n=1 Tax=Batillaria attramentaria TaxID=370345 RepID=A0ABD0JVC0_9CAEN
MLPVFTFGGHAEDTQTSNTQTSSWNKSSSNNNKPVTAGAGSEVKTLQPWRLTSLRCFYKLSPFLFVLPGPGSLGLSTEES